MFEILCVIGAFAGGFVAGKKYGTFTALKEAASKAVKDSLGS